MMHFSHFLENTCQNPNMNKHTLSFTLVKMVFYVKLNKQKLIQLTAQLHKSFPSNKKKKSDLCVLTIFSQKLLKITLL